MTRVSAVCLTMLGLLVASIGPAWPSPKADYRSGKEDFGSVPDPGPRGPAPGLDPGSGAAMGKPDPTMPSRPGRQRPEDLTTQFLTVDAAKRAVDAFVAVRDKYNNEGIEDYNSLEAFVAETEAGKRLEAEVVAHGFDDITDWNVTIMAVGFAYSAIVYDYATDLRQQIEAVRQDRSLDKAMRTRLVAGLTALIPSRNNRSVLQALLRDPIYRDKLRLLQEEE